jgi:hypothetical protein
LRIISLKPKKGKYEVKGREGERRKERRREEKG